ncbi:hypothetical protein [Rheinheimera sp. WS51]|uniref:hypothetical protein n=1 Tax=Rheinheimera sp. WS51 TaxID=3425886 RepID=UPI003D89CADB
MVSLFASSVLLGQLLMNQPIAVNSEQEYNLLNEQPAESQLLACIIFPLCTDPDMRDKEKDTDTTSKDNDSSRLA